MLVFHWAIIHTSRNPSGATRFKLTDADTLSCSTVTVDVKSAAAPLTSHWTLYSTPSAMICGTSQVKETPSVGTKPNVGLSKVDGYPGMVADGTVGRLIDGLAQDWGISSTLAMEIPQSVDNSSQYDCCCCVKLPPCITRLSPAIDTKNNSSCVNCIYPDWNWNIPG